MLRPHLKTHKSVTVAEMQRGEGISGVSVATLSEAQVFVDAGFRSVFITRTIAEEEKFELLLTLAGKADIIIAADNLDVVRKINHYFIKYGRKIKVRAEIDSGLHRCGILPEEGAGFVKKIRGLRGIVFDGIFTHAGQVYAADRRKRKKIAAEEAESLIRVYEELKRENIPCPVRSTGTTPTYEFTHLYPEINEIRPGVYVFMDEMQHLLGVCRREDIAVFILASVISRPAPDRVVINAGSKALGLDKGAHGKEMLKGYGYPANGEGTVVSLSEEHGIMKVPPDSPLRPGDKLRIYPNHACGAVNLFDAFWLLNEKGYVENRINIEARGKNW
jgi:D-serine deaminase-like pyridoxal phosphate-dependent protein